MAKVVTFIKNRVHPLGEPSPLSRRMNQIRDGCFVPLAQLFENHCDLSALPRFRLCGRLDQFVGNPAHCRDDHHNVTLVGSFPNDFDDFPDAGCVAH